MHTKKGADTHGCYKIYTLSNAIKGLVGPDATDPYHLTW